jgi:hypothetical protein
MSVPTNSLSPFMMTQIRELMHRSMSSAERASGTRESRGGAGAERDEQAE